MYASSPPGVAGWRPTCISLQWQHRMRTNRSQLRCTTLMLGRWARVRTDLGGFYFHLIFALGIIALSLATGREFLLLAVPLINLDMLYQWLVFVRFDGYWVLADLTGIPDFFSQVMAFL